MASIQIAFTEISEISDISDCQKWLPIQGNGFHSNYVARWSKILRTRYASYANVNSRTNECLCNCNRIYPAPALPLFYGREYPVLAVWCLGYAYRIYPVGAVSQFLQYGSRQ